MTDSFSIPTTPQDIVLEIISCIQMTQMTKFTNKISSRDERKISTKRIDLTSPREDWTESLEKLYRWIEAQEVDVVDWIP